MIQKLTEAHRTIALDFLGQEPEINLFAIGDIERFGFDATFQTLWGDFNPDTHELRAVLLRYEVNYIPYFRDPHYNPAVFAGIILSDPNYRMISGRAPLVRRLQSAMEEYAAHLTAVKPTFIEKTTFFCKLNQADQLEPFDPEIKIAGPEDASRILKLIRQIDEFSDLLSTNEERLAQNIEMGASRVYFIEDTYGDLITVSQTSAENSGSAMIVGVATKPGYRNQGLMSRCLSRLCHDLLREGKSLCLFYDNPKAGSVYHRLGFETIDQWLMLVLD
jgi:hypothetical protein